MRETRRKATLLLLGLALAAAVVVAGLFVLRANAADWIGKDAIFRYASRNLTFEQKREFYTMLAENGPAGIWETLPDARVGRILQFNTRKTSLQAEIVSNNAGMRSERPYGPKAEDTFRIVTLGDSMVMGTAGKEEDRWGDQIEQILGELDVSVDGKSVEVYSLGIGSWSAVSAATYLSQRISSYDPDLVLVMMVANDLNDLGGVMGIGHVSYAFTPEHRAAGSGVFVDHWPRQQFGSLERNLLASGLGAESLSRWRSAFQAWRRLETLLEQRGGRMVFGVLRSEPLFQELCRKHFVEAGMASSYLETEFFGQSLSHDSHPDREGHRILAVHYLHVLAELGWLPVDRAELPALHEGLSTGMRAIPDLDSLTRLQRAAAETLPEEIVFDQIESRDVVALLGGIFPRSEDRPFEGFPHGTLKSAFLLARRPGAESVRLEVEVPALVELYPFRLEMLIDGQLVDTLVLEESGEAGRHALWGQILATNETGPAIEVSLRTESYWSDITDFTVRSYSLVSASQR